VTALNTAIFVQGPQDPMEIYNVALQQILFYDGRNAAPSHISLHIHTDEDGREVIYFDQSENLPALLAVYHRPGGVMFTEEEAQEQFEAGCTDPTCMRHRPAPAHLIVAFASSIMWEDRGRQWNAGNLHSGLVWSVGGFLDGKKIPWKWQEDIDQETHEGYEELEGLPAGVGKVRAGLANPLGISMMISKEIMKRLGFTTDEG
jgi:hypothetical protein